MSADTYADSLLQEPSAAVVVEADGLASSLAQRAATGLDAAFMTDLAAQASCFEESARALISGCGRLTRDVQAAAPENLTEVIDRLRAEEGRTVAAFQAMFGEIEKALATIRQTLPSPERKRLRELLTSVRKTAVEAMEALRDCRWQLIAVRAEHEDEGEAPLFDNPTELLRYLRSGG